MSNVGTFPGIGSNRRTIRATTNPFDKSTVVSIYPKEINERKPTIQPGNFHIDAGTYNNPALLVVGPSSWWKDIDEDQPLLEIPCSSVQIADSIVRDYCNGLLACDMGDTMPGLFYIPGDINLFKLKKEYSHLLDKALENQKRWYAVLVKLGDIGWSRSNGNPVTISDDMKLAARELQLENKPWLKDFQTMQMVNCVACGALRNPLFPVCQSCKAIIDPEKAKELNIKFAV